MVGDGAAMNGLELLVSFEEIDIIEFARGLSNAQLGAEENRVDSVWDRFTRLYLMKTC